MSPNFPIVLGEGKKEIMEGKKGSESRANDRPKSSLNAYVSTKGKKIKVNYSHNFSPRLTLALLCFSPTAYSTLCCNSYSTLFQ